MSAHLYQQTYQLSHTCVLWSLHLIKFSCDKFSCNNLQLKRGTWMMIQIKVDSKWTIVPAKVLSFNYFGSNFMQHSQLWHLLVLPLTSCFPVDLIPMEKQNQQISLTLCIMVCLDESAGSFILSPHSYHIAYNLQMTTLRTKMLTSKLSALK